MICCFFFAIQIFWAVLAIKSDWLRLKNDLSDNTTKPTMLSIRHWNRIQLLVLSYREQRWPAFICPEKCLVYIELGLKMHQDVLLFRPMRQKRCYREAARDIKQDLWCLCACVLTRTRLMTGQNTSARLGRSTTTTVELRSPSGRSPKTCWRGKHI